MRVASRRRVVLLDVHLVGVDGRPVVAHHPDSASSAALDQAHDRRCYVLWPVAYESDGKVCVLCIKIMSVGEAYFWW